MQAWMKNPAMIVPEAMQAMQALRAATEKGRRLANVCNRLNVATRQVAGEWRS